MLKRLRSSLLLSLVVLTGCSTSLKDMSTYQTPDLSYMAEEMPQDSLSIQYLGVGGHLFRFGDDAIMSAPSITNPHFMLLGPFMPISPDEEMIDQYLPPVDDVQAILVGHAHYDHLMDVPYVMNTKALKSHVYGSKTAGHIVAAEVDNSRIHAMNDIMATPEKAGEWVYNPSKRIRFMAIKSTHAPHFMGINMMTGTYDEDLESLPWHSFGWKEGQTLAFLIDFLGQNGEIQHRVFYQDAASQEPLGLIPQLEAKDQKRVDIAIITPASFNQVDNYPESVMDNTKARHFILGHWEDFFSNQDEEEQRFVRAVDPDDFFERFNAKLPQDSTWTMPELYNTQYFAPHGKMLDSQKQ